MQQTVFTTTYQTPIGTLHAASTDEALIGLWIAGQAYFGMIGNQKMQRTHPAWSLEQAHTKPDHPVLRQTERWLDRYFEQKNPDHRELPLNPVGSDFRKKVWNILCTIPLGSTMTYGTIAKTITQNLGRTSMSAQAVGGAIGHNPISIIIPCHRVVGSNGSLTGYAGGTAIKQQLLMIEGVLG